MQESIDALAKEFPAVDYRPLKLDLSSQKAVRAAAAELLSWPDVPAIDVLVNSAGVMNIPERTITEDGIEIHFATNHIGHFLFTSLIMPKLLKAASGNPPGTTRIVNVTSNSPTVSQMRWSDMNFNKISKDLPKEEQPPYAMLKRFGVLDPEEKSYIPIEGYNQSKVANMLFSVAANKRLAEKHGILSLAVHPGVIRTELSRYAAPETVAAIGEMLKSGAFYIKTLGAGAATSLVAATDPRLRIPASKDGKENYGVYFADCQISEKGAPGAISSEEAEKLWKLSEELVKEKFAW
jgi:NAD(P)-dependent dehydrogenase (short-subunit alcohol dehydrogenase family)